MIRIIVVISLLFISTPSFATEQIKRTQFLLNQLGYNVGSIDGIYGSKTNNALKKFYKNKNEKFDGTLDSNEINDLEDSYERLLPPPSITSTDNRLANTCLAIENETIYDLLSYSNIKNHYNEFWTDYFTINDLYNDGILDLVGHVINGGKKQDPNTKYLHWSANKNLNTSGRWGREITTPYATNTTNGKILSGDINNDSIDDIVYIDYGQHDIVKLMGGDVEIAVSSGDEYVLYNLKDIPRRSFHSGTLIDLNNDGFLDLILLGIPIQSKGTRRIAYLNDKQGNFKRVKYGMNSAFRNDDGWVSATASDIDGDGFQDLILSGDFYKKQPSKIYWGGPYKLGAIDKKAQITSITDAELRGISDPLDIIPYKTSEGKTEILATYYTDNYNSARIAKYKFNGRVQIDSKTLYSGKNPINGGFIISTYPCRDEIFLLNGNLRLTVSKWRGYYLFKLKDKKWEGVKQSTSLNVSKSTLNSQVVNKSVATLTREQKLCRLALHNDKWSNALGVQSYVNKAKKLGLTIDRCIELNK